MRQPRGESPHVERAAGSRPVRPARRRASARAPRIAIAAVAIIALSGGAYVTARQTSLFAVGAIHVSGADEELSEQVEAALTRHLRRSLIALDGGQLAREVERLPHVVAANVDRDFPNTLRVEVTPERPVAVIRQGADAWLVSARSRLLGQVDAKTAPTLPRIWLSTAPRQDPGTYLLPADGGALVAALARLPTPFPMPVEAARGTPDGLVLVLRGKLELRLGEARLLRLKLEVAAAVLRTLGVTERQELAYLDVSVPERPVGGQKSQVSTLG
jgi:cell division septal protein FtsQ